MPESSENDALERFYNETLANKGRDVADEARRLATRRWRRLDFGDALLQAEARVDKRKGTTKAMMQKALQPFNSDWMGRD